MELINRKEVSNVDERNRVISRLSIAGGHLGYVFDVTAIKTFNLEDNICSLQ